MTKERRREIIRARWRRVIRPRLRRWLDNWNEIQRKKMAGELALVGNYYSDYTQEERRLDADYGSGIDDDAPSRQQRRAERSRGNRAHRGPC